MAKANDILTIAKKELGTKESPANSNKTKYGEAYGWNGVPWCCIFVWWCFNQANAGSLFYNGSKTASCTMLMNHAKKNGQWVTSGYKPGDIILFNFDSNKNTADHVGICESYNNGKVTCIEGNTSASGSQSNGGEVMRMVRSSSLVIGAYRPKYDTAAASVPKTVAVSVDLPLLKKGSTGDQVKALQALLNGYGFNCGKVDGDFGSNTDKAAKNFQRAKLLSVDGSVGPATWKALLGA